MLRHNLSKSSTSILVGLVALVLITENVAAQKKYFDTLPEGWKVEKYFVAPKEQTQAISQKLGGRIWILSNTYLSINGQRLQVNISQCRTAKSAEKVYEAMLQAHGGMTDYVLRDGNTVIEFVCRDIKLVKQAHPIFEGVDVQSKGVSQKRISRQMFGNLPPGWQVKESFIVPSEQAGAIGKKLGADIRELSNTVLSAHGQRLQANIIEGVTQEDAKKIHKAMLEAHQGFSACAFRDDTIVLEFSCDDINLAIKAGWECGLKPKPAEAIYKISFEAAPLKKGDFMSWNKLFNLFSALNEAPEDNEIKAQIAKLSKLFTFGEEIDLRTCGGEKTKPTYKFKPIPNKTEAVTQGDITRYTFRNLSQKVEVPYVSIEATVTTREGAFTPTVRKAGSELLGPTEFWPTRDFEVTKLAKKITAGCQSQKEKVEAILEWLTPGKNIKFAGPVTGSRYGVKKVLQQGYGHCWDFSDSFVTLCRASGIPCRQVAGWFYGVSGHIWAEVLFEQKGWQQVDPTGGSVLECGIYHIPYLTSENGNMPILYLSMPKIDLL